jgi:thiol-disulfide isomerase/thioredoxin
MYTPLHRNGRSNVLTFLTLARLHQPYACSQSLLKCGTPAPLSLSGRVPLCKSGFSCNVLTFLTFLTFLTLPALAGVKTGDSFPGLASFKLEGQLPDSTKAKVVLLDFWASWCEPCKQSFPVMEELHKRYAERGLVIIAINVDENRPDMEAFLKKNAATFAIVRDANQKLVEKTGIATMPSSFLVDHDGKVRFMHTGFRGAETKKKYEEEIETLLK